MTTQTAPTAHPTAAPQAPDARQMVSFAFYRVDPAWRRLSSAARKKQGRELLDAVNTFSKRLMVLTYSLIGMKADVDFLVWAVGKTPEELQELAAAINRTGMGGYLSSPYRYLSMTKRSVYIDKLDPDHPDKRRFITPAHAKYFFVYPFVKTREWYHMPYAERQIFMDEHIKAGSKYPSVRLHTTYSFGLDDQEFIVAFETDAPKDFLDLVMELRETKASRYTLRDTPIFTCVAKPMAAILDDLGA